NSCKSNRIVCIFFCIALASNVSLGDSTTSTDRVSRTMNHQPRECRENVRDNIDPKFILRVVAKQIISLFIPVSLCMFIVAAIAKSVPYFASTEVYLIYTPFNTPNADIGTQTWQTLANVGILLGVVVIMTFLLVLLFKFKCYKCLTGWLVATTFILVFVMSFMFFTEILRASMIFFDNITFAILLWNFGVMGLVSIHWRSPLIVKQAYLIFNSVLMALIFLKYLPKWTCWVLLGAMAIWDLIAVLCPRGPLRMLVEMAQKRNRPLHPAMIYSTTSAYALCARRGSNEVGFSHAFPLPLEPLVKQAPPMSTLGSHSIEPTDSGDESAAGNSKPNGEINVSAFWFLF
uniref:Presenilin n=1 Tax=Mesocestoides corti TaxID=53468 RepID=A0A5K3ELM2_MESCO